MKKKEVKKRIEKLKKVINYHRYLYHVLNKQEISAPALDSLKHELYKLEQQFPEFISPDSPTQRVAGRPLKGFKKVEHKVPMLSIEDIFSEKELQEWEDYLKRLIPSQKFEWFAELKIDGFAITLLYKNGILERGATRGNGKVGEDVTQNLKTIESIPLKIRIHSLPDFDFNLSKETKNNIERLINWGMIEIRGEVYMEKRDFEKLNKKMQKRGEKTFANPRNLAAGSIRQLDPTIAGSRPLKFFAYDIITNLGQKKHSQEHKILSMLGFKTDLGKECKNLTEVINYYAETSEKRENFPFQIDGVVLSVDNNQLFDKLGVVGKSPKGIRAFKFPSKQAATIIKDIKLQIGRTGAVTPVAVLKPVEIDGVVISRATLHNEDEIKKLGVRIGDTVIVERAGDVIPSVSKVLPKLRTGKEEKFKMPRFCPSCQTKLVKPEKEVVWRCLNPKCFARRRKYFYHFISKGAFDVVGLGPKIINKLIEEGLVSDPADLFNLKEGDISLLERFAEKSAKNLITAIQSKKEITLPKFIFALGIRNVGEKTAYLLAKKFGSIENLKKASPSDLERIRDIGFAVADSIYDFFHKKRNLELLKKLKKAGVKIGRKERTKYQPLRGRTFVLTGALETLTRDEAKKRIRELGGEISESVSEKIDYVIVGEKPGSKLKEVKKFGIKRIGEQEFLKLIQ
ncbi:MAG: NAD-dependent DNA ligase LigA [Candidatus Nealsonbacteria bacterium]|nr:MAG: NAD-dependent DNA ligase LigA [Candidatus Nealsonbacteria bacterium]